MKKVSKESKAPVTEVSLEEVEKPKQKILIQPNPGPQTSFLAATAQEVVYGGSAGRGKS